MKTRQMTGLDRTLRGLVAVAVVALWATGAIAGTVAVVLALMAAAFVLTMLAGNCLFCIPLSSSRRKRGGGTAESED